MRAIVFEQHGEPDEVLQVRDVPTPQPARGEVRVRVLASPINPSDLLYVRGIYGKLPKLPATPGFEGVGVVESSGGGLLANRLVGKRVAVLNSRTGAWCDYVVLSAVQAIEIPASLPDEQAAMFFVNPATAFAMTRKVFGIPRGAWLLQTAAGSAVGRMVVRLGRRFGFRTINVVRRTGQANELTAMGADQVVVFDGEHEDAGQLIRTVTEITGDERLRYALDPVGGPTGSAVVPCLGSGGRMLVYGTLCDKPLVVSPRELMSCGASVEGFWLAPWIRSQGLWSKLRLVRSIIALMRDGVLTSTVGDSFPLDRIGDAVRAAEGVRTGKILLRTC